jgi:glycerophosphoryl diester phosphodiesterase
MQRPPLIIRHHGVSFDLPEHILEGYRLALELGADYIDPDLIPTTDDHLVATHLFNLNITTDIQHVFPHRARLPQYSGNHTNSDTLCT